jgi:hypothetical protein
VILCGGGERRDVRGRKSAAVKAFRSEIEACSCPREGEMNSGEDRRRRGGREEKRANQKSDGASMFRGIWMLVRL